MKKRELLQFIENNRIQWYRHDDWLHVCEEDVRLTLNLTFPEDSKLESTEIATGNSWPWITVPDTDTIMPIRSYTLYFQGIPIHSFETVTVDGFRCVVPYPSTAALTYDNTTIQKITRLQDGLGFALNGDHWELDKKMLRLKVEDAPEFFVY